MNFIDEWLHKAEVLFDGWQFFTFLSRKALFWHHSLLFLCRVAVSSR